MLSAINDIILNVPNNLQILNDPIYGFITIPNTIVKEIIEHPYFQRLRRISQMGLSYLVYPGAHHTRFHHALGCLYLMQKAVRVLRFKHIDISKEEEEALYIAILLHDIGHGPFSHALENHFINGASHENISLMVMQELNVVFNERLTLAIEIYKGNYNKPFFGELISGQIDMDRLDYLKRDSFYSGTPEGNINSERLITMLNVIDNKLVIEEKGVYSIEKFIVARRFMYWQVYLHKTSIVAEHMLINCMHRAKKLITQGVELIGSPALLYFLKNTDNTFALDNHSLQHFLKLDDYDIISALKSWISSEDKILKMLSEMLINRQLLKIKIKKLPFSSDQLLPLKQKYKHKYKLSDEEVDYLVFDGIFSNQAYNKENQIIKIVSKKGKIKNISQLSDQISNKALTEKITKYYICYPK